MACEYAWSCIQECLDMLWKREPRTKTLIITTGDVSDVDGFMALAQYAKTGADVQFIMNYPAYLNVDEEVDSHESKFPGLGYRYSAKEVIERDHCHDLLKHRHENANLDMKDALTDLGWQMASKVWSEANMKGGKLFYTVGGVNSVNPFSKTAIKNELSVYSAIAGPSEISLPVTEGYTRSSDGKGMDCMDYQQYTSIYIDFNGSMSFLNPSWLEKLICDDKVKGAFVMGGVLAYEPPQTMPAIRGTINRFSCATMNQLYHPAKTADFFDLLKTSRVPVYIVSNNAVSDLTTFDSTDPKVKNLDGIHRFMHSNRIDGPILKDFAQAYYESKYNPPRKPFDYYTALALTEATCDGKALDGSKQEWLFYCREFGVALIGHSNSWQETLLDYDSRIDKEIKDADSDFIKAKKDNFRKEIEALKARPALPCLPVWTVPFSLDSDSKQLTVVARPEPPGPAPAAAAGAKKGQ